MSISFTREPVGTASSTLTNYWQLLSNVQSVLRTYGSSPRTESAHAFVPSLSKDSSTLTFKDPIEVMRSLDSPAHLCYSLSSGTHPWGPSLFYSTDVPTTYQQRTTEAHPNRSPKAGREHNGTEQNAHTRIRR